MNGGICNGVRILNESTVELMHKVQMPGKKLSAFPIPTYPGLGFNTQFPLFPSKKRIGHS
jgi:hypothetical protein